jgi:hypothetical protein
LHANQFVDVPLFGVGDAFAVAVGPLRDGVQRGVMAGAGFFRFLARNLDAGLE